MSKSRLEQAGAGGGIPAQGRGWEATFQALNLGFFGASPTFLTHGPSFPRGAAAGEVLAVVLAGATVQAGVGLAGPGGSDRKSVV